MAEAPFLAEIHSRSLALEGFEDRVARKVRRILAELAREIEAELARFEAGSKKSLYRRSRLTSLLRSLGSSIGESYDQIADELDDELRKLAGTELRWGNRTFSSVLGKGGLGVHVGSVAISPEIVRVLADTPILPFGSSEAAAPARDWLAGQTDRVVAELTKEVRVGILAGDSIDKILARVLGNEETAGVFTRAGNWAEAVVRTSVNAVANTAHRQLYAANDNVLKGVYQVTTRDNRTTIICLAYAGKSWLLQRGRYIPQGHSLPYHGGCPRHIGCRSRDVPWVKSWREMGLKKAEVPKELWSAFDGQVPSNLSGAAILKQGGARIGESVLGATRWNLWRSGKLSLEDMIAPDGTVRTLKELVSSGLVSKSAISG